MQHRTRKFWTTLDGYHRPLQAQRQIVKMHTLNRQDSTVDLFGAIATIHPPHLLQLGRGVLTGRGIHGLSWLSCMGCANVNLEQPEPRWSCRSLTWEMHICPTLRAFVQTTIRHRSSGWRCLSAWWGVRQTLATAAAVFGLNDAAQAARHASSDMTRLPSGIVEVICAGPRCLPSRLRSGDNHQDFCVDRRRTTLVVVPQGNGGVLPPHPSAKSSKDIYRLCYMHEIFEMALPW